MIRNIIMISGCMALFAFAPLAFADDVSLDGSVTLTVAHGWERLDHSSLDQAPAAVTAMLDCAGEDPGETKLLGWKLDEEQALQAAYCISFQKKGMGKLRKILVSETGESTQKAADAFIDTFAARLKEEYSVKRSMRLHDVSADLMRADNDVIMVMDGKITGRDKEFLRCLMIVLHGDSLLNIGFVYDRKAPESIVRKLDAMPVSIRWQ